MRLIRISEIETQDQLTALDTKITEAEALVSKLKETTVPKLDIETM